MKSQKDRLRSFSDMRIIASLFFTLFIVATGVAQSVSFYTTINTKQVVENGVFDLRFVVKNANGRGIKYPSLDGFEIISGPNSESSIQIVNGRRTSTVSYSFTLLAKKAGTYTIGPATVQVDRSTINTRPLTIKVTKGKPGSTSNGVVMPTDEQVFLRAEMDTIGIYPGQQIIVAYQIYTAVNIRNYNPLSEDDYTGFHFRYVRDFRARAHNETIDGVQYKVQALKTVSLFPEKIGFYKIDPFIVNVGIGVKDNRRSFFFNSRTIPKTVSSNELAFEVLPLPPGAPPTFTGAVGKYTIEASIQSNQITTDDALVLTLQITGDGDSKRWSVPSLDYLSDQFEIYEPKIKMDKSLDDRGVIRNRRMIEYLMIPKTAGRKNFTANFTYFNPDSAKYFTLRSRPIRIQVTQGDGVKGIIADIEDEGPAPELHPLQSPDKLQSKSPLFIYSPPFYFLCIAPFFYLAFVVRDEKKKNAYDGLSADEKRRLEARNRALKFLEDANALMQSTDKKYYQAISDALFAYISGKLKIPASELSKENVESKLTQFGIPDEQRASVLEITNRCEQVLYAAGSAESQRQVTYDDTLGLIMRIEDCLA